MSEIKVENDTANYYKKKKRKNFSISLDLKMVISIVIDYSGVW